MTHHFVFQPYADGFSLANAFGQFVGLEPPIDLDIVVAWAKRTGLLAIESKLDEIRKTGGKMRAFIGISQGGTSLQALEMALHTFDETWLFHLPGRTFHPKVYVARGARSAMSLVGSHNLTGGGVQNNFEAGVFSELDTAEDADAKYLGEILSFIDRLRGDPAVCVPLDAETLELIAENYWLDDEDAAPKGAEPNEEGRSESEERDGGLFGPSAFELKKAWSKGSTSKHGSDLAVTSGTSPTRAASKAGGAANASASLPTPAPAPGQAQTRASSAGTKVLRRWFKELKPIDAQQPGTGHASNTLTLVQGGHPIRREVYFRDVFFGDAEWTKTTTSGRQPKAREVAVIQMEVIVDGKSLGNYTFDIRHTPEYDSGQNNRVTELRWGDLGAYLRRHDLSGRIVSLEKLQSGYRMIIAGSPSGPFIK